MTQKSRSGLFKEWRVESGETFPNGDSLVKLSNALDVTLDDILEIAPSEDVGYLTLMNLSALTFMIHPFLGIVSPLVMWILKKEKIKGVNDAGKKLVIFQIVWTLVLYITLFIHNEARFIMLDIRIDHVMYALIGGRISLTGFILVGLFLLNVLFIFINTTRNRLGKDSIILPSFRI